MMSGMINNRKFALFLSTALQFSCLCAFCEIAGVSRNGYWTGQTNIVAVVSAYELMTHLPSGETVPFYSTNINSLSTNHYTILFYIVSPQECYGKYFRLEECESKPIFGSNHLPPAYQLGMLYYFPYENRISHDNPNTSSWFGIVSSDLFSISSPSGKKIFVGRVAGGNVYYSTQQEAIDALAALKREHDVIEMKIRSLFDEIEKIKLTKKNSNLKNDPQFRRLKGRFLDLKLGRLPSNESKQKEVRMQIEKLEHLEKDAAL